MRVSWTVTQAGVGGKGYFEEIYVATSYFQEAPGLQSAKTLSTEVHKVLWDLFTKDPHSIVIVSVSIGVVDLEGAAKQAERLRNSQYHPDQQKLKFDSDVDIDLSGSDEGDAK